MARLCAAAGRGTWASPERLHCAFRVGFCAFQQRLRGFGSLCLRPVPAVCGKCRSQGPRLLPVGSAFSEIASPRSFSAIYWDPKLRTYLLSCPKDMPLLGMHVRPSMASRTYDRPRCPGTRATQPAHGLRGLQRVLFLDIFTVKWPF